MGLFDNSMIKELTQFHRNKVLRRITQQELYTYAIPAIWIHTHRMVNIPNKDPIRKQKCRLTVLGNTDNNITETYSGTPDAGQMNIIYYIVHNIRTVKRLGHCNHRCSNSVLTSQASNKYN
eukprot:GHVR01096470.1.p1 GENE.GHVR01096470.1~~GHVR01096470.1.p1  ORF type:complete len:121 (-),score=7.94 GHVR01096470.1:506-868(-)